MLNDIDKKRKFNYKYYTEQEWGKSQNYDLTLSSSALGLDQCVDLIYGVVEKGLER